MVQLNEVVWNDDGHEMVLSLNQSELVILTVMCPSPQGPCHHPEVGCVVTWFLNRFGLDCHVGIAPPSEYMKIAWSWAGSQTDLDSAQVWVMSVDDDFYSAWAASQRVSSDPNT